MKKLKSILAAVAVGIAAITMTGCGTLAPNGVYAQKKTLYYTDQTFETTHDILDAFLKWEHQHGDALFDLAPQVKHTADQIRKDAPAWITAYKTARSAYKLSPTKDNASMMEQALSELERLALAGQSIATHFQAKTL